jgi:hypothetical protein
MLDDASPRVFDLQIEAHVAMISQLNATSATLHVAAKSTHVVVRVPTHAIQVVGASSFHVGALGNEPYAIEI